MAVPYGFCGNEAGRAREAMSEEKPLPCAWCGKEPRAKKHVLEDRIDIQCLGPCPSPTLNMPFASGSYNWNMLQSRILAQRRKDFEAGWQDGVVEGVRKKGRARNNGHRNNSYSN